MIVLTDCPGSPFHMPIGGAAGFSTTRVAPEFRRAWDLFRDTLRDPFLVELPQEHAVPLLVVVDRASGSQFDRLAEALRAGTVFPDGTSAVALEGSGFHGNRGRPWAAVRGNIHLTSVFQVNCTASFLKAGLSMVPTVAAVEALDEAVGVSGTIKWVNDVEIGLRKLCGTLTSTLGQAGKIETVLYGIGLNVEQAPAVLPTVFVPGVTCLADEQPGLDAGICLRVLLRLLAALRRNLDLLIAEGPRPLLEKYTRYAGILGEAVRVWAEEAGQDPSMLKSTMPLGAGRVTGFDESLNLYLQDCPHPVTRGRLARETACRALGL